jgi:hypothetical protein
MLDAATKLCGGWTNRMRECAVCPVAIAFSIDPRKFASLESLANSESLLLDA